MKKLLLKSWPIVVCCLAAAIGVQALAPSASAEPIVGAPQEWRLPTSSEIPPTTNPPKPIVGLPGASIEAAIQATPTKERFPKRFSPRHVPGLGWGDVGSKGTFRTRDPDGQLVYGIPEAVPGPLEAGSANIPLPAATTAGAHASMCVAEKQRIALVYAYPAGAYSVAEESRIKALIWRLNTKVAWEAFRSSGGTRTLSLRVECDWPQPELGWSIFPKVYSVPIDGSMLPTRINAQVKTALGTNWLLPEWSDARKLLVFAQGTDPSPPSDRVAGIAFVTGLLSSAGQGKDPDAARVWNTRDELAVTYEPYWESHASLHELFHLMGAVASNPGPLFGTGGGHCWYGYALMCYHDRGPRGPLYTSAGCADVSPNGYSIDCNYWTHFRAGHRIVDEENPFSVALDGWLENHWNVAGAENRSVTAMPSWDYEVPCEPCERPRGWPFVE